ncbi:MAG TPA: hypothetical protein P5572_11900, partial [Phycisphaerae bacterium]|nr:hypothetical protein [Phycisphaerae bacterium]
RFDEACHEEVAALLPLVEVFDRLVADPCSGMMRFVEVGRERTEVLPVLFGSCISELVDLIDIDPPHAVCLLYTQPASTMVSDWLMAVGFAGGERVIGGPEAERIRAEAGGEPIASVLLPAQIRHVSRSRDEVLATIHEPLQR